MAKKDHKVDDYEEFDIDYDNFDDDFGEDDGETNGKPRSVSSKIKTTLRQSAEQKFQDSKFRREVLKASLPSEYTAVLEDYDTVSKEVGDVWREQKKEWEKNRSGIKKAVKPYSDIIGKLGFKKLQEWAEAEDRVSAGTPSDDEMDELKVQSLMADVFEGMQDKQTQQLTQLETARQSREDERYADATADRETSGKRAIESNTYLANINNGITTLADYSNKIDFQYKKRSLELQARLLVTQQRALTTLSSFRELAVKELQEIHKNTALPDYLKIKNDELITRTIKEKMAENLSAPFSGASAKLSKRVFGKVKSKMTDWWRTIGEVVSGANEANEGFSDMAGGVGGGGGTAWDGLKNMLGGAASDWAVNKPANFIKDKLTPKIREYLEKNHNLVVHGSNLKSMGSQFSDLLNEALKSGETGSKLGNKIVELFDLQEAAITEKNTVWDKNDLDLEKSVYMDNRFKLTVTDIIPGWLKKIYGQVFGLNNQGFEPDDQTWDFKSSKFINTADAHEKTLDGLVNRDNIKKHEEATERWVEIVGDGASFSKKTHKFLKTWVSKQIRSSDAINPMKLLSDTLVAPKDVKAELEAVITASYQLTAKQVELAKAGTMKDITDVSRQGNLYSNDRLNKTADAANDLKKFSRLIPEEQLIKLALTPEGRAALIAKGIVYDSGNGQMSYNYNIEDGIRDQFEYGRARERKVDGKTVKDFVGYERTRNVRHEDGKSFLTDDVRNDRLDSDGYDDREVRLKQGAKFGGGFGYLGLNDEQRFEKQIRRSLEGVPDPTQLPNYGREFFFTKDGKLITSANRNYLRLRAMHAPQLHKRLTGYAAGGRIPSFASGGDNKLKSGVTQGQPGDENIVKTHGGEFVVGHDAAKFNVQLLSAINKYGAPLINADGSVNSVYHKLFGFDKAKDFAKQTGKDIAVGSKNIKNEQAEIAIKGILGQISPIHTTDYAIIASELTDTKVSPEKRLVKALKHWTKYQKTVLKNEGALAYGKGLASKGINIAGGKFDKWLDSDGTGTNIEIKNQLLKGAKNFGRGAYGNFTNFAGDLKDKARNHMLDRGQTAEAISKTLAEVENPKMFIMPIDLYFAGKAKPFLTKKGFINGEYVDQSTGALIKNPSNILGTIVDREGSVIVTIEELMAEDIVTKSRKPYRLLGLEEKHRKYQTASEYIGNRYSMIASSQKVKDALQKGKDFRDKYLRDEAVDCYLRKDNITPVLRASVFKEGGYVDQATGNVLWTHHDITSAVTDTKGSIIVSAEDVADGLFDSKGVQLKINKFKQMRNMVFRRGAETYNRYAAKHVTRFKNAALNGMSAMGEKRVGLNFDDDPIDVYVKGENKPRITMPMFKSGAMMDVKSGKPIMSHSGIQGAVISSGNASGNQLITEDDIKTGLVDALGEDLYLPKMKSAMSRFSTYLKEAVLPKGKFGGLRNFITMSPQKRLEELNKLIDKHGIAFDVYVLGEPLTPRLTKVGFESSEYLSQNTGLAIKIPEFIDGPVIDLNGNIILTAEEIAKGLVTIDGKKVKIGVDFKGGGLFNNLMGSASIMGRIQGKRDMLLKGLGMGGTPADLPEEDKVEHNTLYTIKFKTKKGKPLSPEAARINNRMFTKEDIKGGMLVSIGYEDGKSSTEIIDDVENIDRSTWLKSAMSDKITDGINFGAVFTMGGYIIDDEGKLIKTAFHTGKKKTKLPKLDLAGVSPLKGMFGGAFDSMLDKLGLKNRFGSWQQQREDKAKAKLEGATTDEKKEKKDSWIGKLIKRLTLPLTAMFGGITAGLGAMKASFMGGLAWLGQSVVKGKLMGSLGGYMGRSGLGRALAVGAVAYGGLKAYNYLDGDGSGPSSYGAGDTNASYAGMDTTSKVSNLAAAAKDGKAKSGFLDTLTNNPEIASALAMGAMMLPGRFKAIGKGLWGVGKATVKGAGNIIGWGARKLGVGAARAGAGAAARAPGMLGTVGRVAASVWSMTGGGLGAAARLAPLLAGAGGLIFPALLIGGAFAGGWYLGKAILKGWNNNKNPWNRFRMSQYGFNHNNEEVKNKIIKIETVASTLVSIDASGQPKLKSDEKAIIEILKTCEIYDEQGKLIEGKEERLTNFAIWFKERFLRVFASYLTCLKRIRGKAEMIDLSTLNRKEQQTLANEVHFKNLTNSPYVILQSPFEDPSETSEDATAVDVIFRKLTNKIASDKDIKDGEVKDYSKIKSEDGLDAATTKPLPKNASHEDKLKHEMDKQLDGTVKTKADAKTMVDKANAAVKYQTDAANVLTKTHNAQIRAATDKATEETEKQFETSSMSLMERFESFMEGLGTRASNALGRMKNGEVVGGLSDLVSTGTSLLTGGLSDTVGGGISQAGNAIAGWLGDGKGLGGSGEWSKGKRDDLFPSIAAASKKYGLSERTMLTMAYIESKGDPNASNASGAKGIYQFIPDTAKAYGLGNPYDQAANIDAGMRLTRDGIAYFKKKVGREPEPYEIYLMHQQGQGGLSLIAAAAAKGGNVPANIQKNMDSNAPQKGMTPAAFLAYWKKRYNDSDLAVHGSGGGTVAPDAPVNAAAPAAGGTPVATPASTATPGKLPDYAVTGGSNKSAAPAANTGGGGGGGGGTPVVVKGKPKVFFGDSIALGYKTAFKAEGWATAGASPQTVLYYLSKSILEDPKKYKDKEIYLSTGMSNNPTDTLNIATQLLRLKECGVKANVLGVSNQYPKGNPTGLNTVLATLCKRFGHTFLGGFNAGKDKVHPASYNTLPGGSSTTPKAAPVAPAKAAATTPVKASTSLPAYALTGGGNKVSANAATNTQTSNTSNVAGSADWDFDKIAKAALTNRLGAASGKCAEYVRKALTAGDLRGKIQKQFGGKLGNAHEYLTKLPNLGFNRVYSGSSLKSFQLMKGDVVVFDRGVYGSDNKSGGGWVYGHVAIWTGGNWVSDFIQNTVYPHSKYASKGIPFSIFRANGIAKEKVADCKFPGDEDFGKALSQSNPTSAQAANTQQQATQVTEASKVNDTVNGLNNGGMNNSAAPNQTPTQSNPLDSGATGSEVINLLGKQLSVQQQMLSVLKDIAKGTNLTGGGNGQGMTTPDLSAIRNEKSAFDGVTNPVSVLKPV